MIGLAACREVFRIRLPCPSARECELPGEPTPAADSSRIRSVESDLVPCSSAQPPASRTFARARFRFSIGRELGMIWVGEGLVGVRLPASKIQQC